MVRYKRRRYRRKRNFKRQSISALRRQVKAIASNAELKYNDLEDQTDIFKPYNGDWNRVCLNPLVQGTTAHTRVGNKVKMKRFTLRGYIVNNRGTPEDTMMRLVIFRAKLPNNAEQTEDLLFENGDSINTLRNMEHKTRFKVYFDQTFTMKASTDESTQQYLPIKINIPLNSVTTFNGNAGTYADIERNGIYMLLTSATPVEANCPMLYYDQRFTYYDS